MIHLSYIVHYKQTKDNLIRSLLYFHENKEEKMLLLGFVSNFYKSPNKFVKHSLLLYIDCFIRIKNM